MKGEGKEVTGKVPIPEEFQTRATELVNSCDSEESLSFLNSLVYKKQDEVRMSKAKSEKSIKGKKSIPVKYSLEDAPTS